MTGNNNIHSMDAWTALKKFTPARIGLGRTGISVPVKEMLQFKMDHAHARDAVFSLLDIDAMLNNLQPFNLPVYVLKSKAADKHIYLKRPDLGRRLHQDSMNRLNSVTGISYDVCLTITDGLSATAIHNHCTTVLSLLLPMLAASKINMEPLCLTEYGRVAIADETSFLLKAKLAVLLIGERPGLSAHDSMGAYITYNPKPGLTDESRNCISNIRPEGLHYNHAASKMFYLIKEALRLQFSGVGLKENNSVEMRHVST
jgi:ethanolamine ammonia-lyase small subunit